MNICFREREKIDFNLSFVGKKANFDNQFGQKDSTRVSEEK